MGRGGGCGNGALKWLCFQRRAPTTYKCQLTTNSINSNQKVRMKWTKTNLLEKPQRIDVYDFLHLAQLRIFYICISKCGGVAYALKSSTGLNTNEQMKATNSIVLISADNWKYNERDKKYNKRNVILVVPCMNIEIGWSPLVETLNITFHVNVSNEPIMNFNFWIFHSRQWQIIIINTKEDVRKKKC